MARVDSNHSGINSQWIPIEIQKNCRSNSPQKLPEGTCSLEVRSYKKKYDLQGHHNALNILFFQVDVRTQNYPKLKPATVRKYNLECFAVWKEISGFMKIRQVCEVILTGTRSKIPDNYSMKRGTNLIQMEAAKDFFLSPVAPLQTSHQNKITIRNLVILG